MKRRYKPKAENIKKITTYFKKVKDGIDKSADSSRGK